MLGEHFLELGKGRKQEEEVGGTVRISGRGQQEWWRKAMCDLGRIRISEDAAGHSRPEAELHATTSVVLPPPEASVTDTLVPSAYYVMVMCDLRLDSMKGSPGPKSQEILLCFAGERGWGKSMQ